MRLLSQLLDQEGRDGGLWVSRLGLTLSFCPSWLKAGTGEHTVVPGLGGLPIAPRCPCAQLHSTTDVVLTPFDSRAAETLPALVSS